VSVTEIAGYGYCRHCDRLTPHEVLDRSGFLCGKCIEAGVMPHPSVSIRIDAAVIPIRKSIKIKGSKGKRSTRNAARRAHHAAGKRLRDCFPELYRLLYLAERANQGLDPVRLFAVPALEREALMRAIEAAGERLEDNGLYDALRADQEESCRH
jgi:hypothetical protein